MVHDVAHGGAELPLRESRRPVRARRRGRFRGIFCRAEDDEICSDLVRCGDDLLLRNPGVLHAADRRTGREARGGRGLRLSEHALACLGAERPHLAQTRRSPPGTCWERPRRESELAERAGVDDMEEVEGGIGPVELAQHTVQEFREEEPTDRDEHTSHRRSSPSTSAASAATRTSGTVTTLTRRYSRAGTSTPCRRAKVSHSI